MDAALERLPYRSCRVRWARGGCPGYWPSSYFRRWRRYIDLPTRASALHGKSPKRRPTANSRWLRCQKNSRIARSVAAFEERRLFWIETKQLTQTAQFSIINNQQNRCLMQSRRRLWLVTKTFTERIAYSYRSNDADFSSGTAFVMALLHSHRNVNRLPLYAHSMIQHWSHRSWGAVAPQRRWGDSTARGQRARIIERAGSRMKTWRWWWLAKKRHGYFPFAEKVSFHYVKIYTI